MSVPTRDQAIGEAWEELQERVSKLLPNLNAGQCEEILEHTNNGDYDALEFLVSYIEKNNASAVL